MSQKKSLASLGEFGFIDRIAASARNGLGVVTGIGDDAAVTALSPGMQLLTSTDMLLEDVHFRRAWHDPYRLGRKSLAVNISDLAAMGSIPRWATLSLAIPAGLSLEFLEQFTQGFLAMAAEHGVSLVGGDTCSSRGGLAISVTIMGEQFPDRILRRSGARPEDDIWVTGTLGDAALGLNLLEKKLPLPEGEGGGEGENVFLISRLLDPTPRVSAGLALAESGLVTAMIDVSDGLLADFGHIAEMSGVGGTLRMQDFPVSEAFHGLAATMDSYPWHCLVAGGEDYELAFTASPANREKIAGIMKNCGIKAMPVGIVTSLPEVKGVMPDGTCWQPQNRGYNHFS